MSLRLLDMKLSFENVMWGHSYHRRRRNRDVRRAAERAERDAQASTRDAQGTSSG